MGERVRGVWQCRVRTVVLVYFLAWDYGGGGGLWLRS